VEELRLPLSRLHGISHAMEALRQDMIKVAPHRTTVLVTGESGTGKELVARAIHDLSPRADQPFIAVNCAAMASSLLESELFGHCRGAFTDAFKDRQGLFEAADGGTLFLDEIGEISMAVQAKLLRVLQESEVRPVGSSTSVAVDVRVIAATLRDLSADVQAGRFREDLFYRLNVVPLAIPPLRSRAEDIPLLIAHFAQRHREQGRSAVWPIQTVSWLQTLPWPGNVRELENVIERASLLSEASHISVEFLQLLIYGSSTGIASNKRDSLSIKQATRQLEQQLIRKALTATSGNRTTAAKLLEISHRALLYKIKEYGISRSDNLDK
jgi:two-component system, NtrC family, response regulator AtoC